MWQWIRTLKDKTLSFVTKNPKLTVLIILAFIGAFIIGNIELLHYTSDPSFCEICHPKPGTGPLTEVYTWRKSVHAKDGVECLDCHGKPGFFGYMRAKIGGLDDVYGQLFRSPERRIEVMKEAAQPAYAAKLVPNETCLFCHSDSVNEKIRKERLMSVGVSFRKLDGVVNPGFRKQYKLPEVLTEDVGADAAVAPHHPKHIEKGINCVDCHLGVAHGGEARNLPKMQTCFDCHDKKRAGNLNPPANEDCLACHRKSEGLYPRKPIVFGKGDTAVKFEHVIHVAVNKCNDCHNALFPMKTDGPRIAFADHAAGKFCFACHNGKKAFAYTTCTNCHAKAPFPKAPIVYKPAGAAPVSFSHEFHTAVFACDKCHPGIWPMKKGAKKMNMDALYEGKFCGVCHNDKVAFAATNCDRCHVEAKK